MRKHITCLFTALAAVLCVSCTTPVVEVYGDAFSVTCDVDASFSGLTLTIHDGVPSDTYTVDYTIDSDEGLLLCSGGRPLESPFTLSSDDGPDATFALPPLPAGRHRVVMTVTSSAGSRCRCECAFDIAAGPQDKVSGIVLSATAVYVRMGQSQSVAYTIEPDGGSVRPTVSVADGSVASASVGDGVIVVSGLAAGTTQMSVKCGGLVETVGVTVYEYSQQPSVTVSPGSVMNLEKGATATFSVNASAPYEIDYNGEFLELVDKTGTSFTFRNVNPDFFDMDVSFSVRLVGDPTVKALVGMYIKGRPETIAVSNTYTGAGVAKYSVTGENMGWSIVAVPAGLKESVSGSTITLTNDSGKPVTGVLDVRTSRQGVTASVSVSVPAR